MVEQGIWPTFELSSHTAERLGGNHEGTGYETYFPASILNDCIEELERREADALDVADQAEDSPSFATAYRHRAAAFNHAANLLREKTLASNVSHPLQEEH